ncbi:MAG: PIN domain-containing protein [Dethiobacteria bacterium]|nr:PIN domain-containing protein [Bacillota bacterium]
MSGINNQRQFVDTNIFLYAYDLSEPLKREKAQKLISSLWQSRQGVISIQVLQELYVNLTRKLPKPISAERAAQIITDLGQWSLHEPTLADLKRAIDLEKLHKLSFWDAMIVSSAQQMGCKLLWTEDLNSGQYIDDLIIRNPFSKKS